MTHLMLDFNYVILYNFRVTYLQEGSDSYSTFRTSTCDHGVCKKE